MVGEQREAALLGHHPLAEPLEQFGEPLGVVPARERIRRDDEAGSELLGLVEVLLVERNVRVLARTPLPVHPVDGRELARDTIGRLRGSLDLGRLGKDAVQVERVDERLRVADALRPLRVERRDRLERASKRGGEPRVLVDEEPPLRGQVR